MNKLYFSNVTKVVMITIMGIGMIIVMVVVMMLISTHWHFDSNLKDLGGCMIGARFLLVDARTMQAMASRGVGRMNVMGVVKTSVIVIEMIIDRGVGMMLIM